MYERYVPGDCVFECRVVVWQALCEEGLLSVTAGVLILQVAPQQPVHCVPSVHEVTQEGLVAARGVLHVLELELKDKGIDAVPADNRRHEDKH